MITKSHKDTHRARANALVLWVSLFYSFLALMMNDSGNIFALLGA